MKDIKVGDQVRYGGRLWTVERVNKIPDSILERLPSCCASVSQVLLRAGDETLWVPNHLLDN